ncbi:uncharacterized protein LOC142591444 [Dermacentor variabilis]|uniref:uncharacterized protein LOC142591444 n=1 Tax=Dermacentor variabilis TaxID=34621 RepID=UPI003F5BC63F
MRIGLTMKYFSLCAYLCVLLNLALPDIAYGDQSASCILCFCKNGRSKCALGTDKCVCRHGRLYLDHKRGCIVYAEDCGLHLNRTNSKPGCLSCQCSRGSDHCELIGSDCTCRDGNVYVTASGNQCVRDMNVCWPPYSNTGTCAKCACPDGSRTCGSPWSKCSCINGNYYLPDSDECVRNEEDCIFPSPTRTCAECSCPHGSRVCSTPGNKCDCINGRYYMTDSGDCAENEFDCTSASPTSTCARCTCPPGERKCNLLGNKCDCIDGKYYMHGSDECVQNKEDCRLVSPVSTCARCTCPSGEKKCHLLGNRCDCIDGKYYMHGSDECVQNKEDCRLVSPVSAKAPCRSLGEAVRRSQANRSLEMETVDDAAHPDELSSKGTWFIRRKGRFTPEQSDASAVREPAGSGTRPNPRLGNKLAARSVEKQHAEVPEGA